MAVSFFDQFMSPTYCQIPLVILALSLPFIITPHPNNLWVNDRTVTLKTWFINLATSQLFSPLKKSGHNWALIIVSLLIFILTMNIMGLLPYTFTPTTQLSLNLALAVPLWLATVIIGLRNNPTHSLGHLLPEGTPNLLIPALVIIETISLFIRPLALGVRLTANLTAGHLLIQLIATATMVLTPMYVTVGALTASLLLLLTGLEIAVALIQAYVFALLLCLYLQDNI